MQNIPPVSDTQQKKVIREKLLFSYRQLILESLPIAIDRAIKEAEIKLMLSVNESMDGMLRADFSISLQMLETRSHWLSEQVSKGVVSALQSIEKNTLLDISSFQNTDNNSTLSVVEKHDFEDWLAMRTAIRLIEESLGYELNRLCHVFEVISDITVDTVDCPVGPSNIIRFFQLGCSHIEIPSSSYPIIYKILGQILRSELKDIYGVLISSAERYGIQGSSSKEETRVISARTNYASSNNTKNDLASTGSTGSSDYINTQTLGVEKQNTEATFNQSETYSTLQKLINLRASVEGGGAMTAAVGNVAFSATDSSKPYYRRDDIVNVVNQLQHAQINNDVNTNAYPDKTNESLVDVDNARPNTGNVIELPLKDIVKKRLEENGNTEARLGEKDNELIDITDSLFESILENIGVSDVFKKWLKKLKLSVLKVVLLDDTFFSNHDHPARQVINQLARLIGTKRTPNRSLERSLEHFTDRIINEYHGDIGLFEEMLLEINQLVARQEEAFKRNSERVARAYEGQQRLIDGRETVINEVNSRIAGKKVPKVLISLLEEGGWRQLLLVTLLREGEESRQFKEALSVVDQLVEWLGEPGDDDASIGDDLEKDLEAPAFLTMIDRELLSTGQVSHNLIFNELKGCLLQGKKTLFVDVDKYDWPIDQSEGSFSPSVDSGKKEAASTGSNRWLKRARMMIIGDWVEILDEEGVAQRMRLAWSGSKSLRFVFVDSQGMKDIDISLEELADRMSVGKATLLDKEEVPVIDQGLHQMVQSVYEDLSNQASCDSLTGLLNRQSFERSMERAVADAMSHKNPHVVCYLDIDQFKVVNNTYGHIAGDQLLKHVATVIKEFSGTSIKEHSGLSTTCGRLGGNEFGLIFDNCEIEEGRTVLDSIRQAVEDAVFLWQEQTLVVTVSGGLAEIDSTSDNIDTVMKKASVACNLSKEHGRNRVTVYTRQDRDQIHHDDMISWIQRIDHSLEGLLMLRCQEIRPINKAMNKPSHYEILLGVYDEDKNILPPVPLIEAAEHFGRMYRVDKWVIHNTLLWMETNSNIVDKIDGFSINLSGTSINEEHFLDFVLGELSATSVPRHKICFEITETAAITNLSNANNFITVLRKTGCKFSLDDFGTGLSSYEYIQKLPLDFIKIDGVFIKNIVHNKKDQALVRSINELAHFMGMQTIAEFVENDEILSVLKLIGVDHAQGYGISRPIPLDEAF